MVLITESLIRKRAEHNNLEISTLEEVSLHQQDIEKIEHIDKWCRELKILYLQSNLIPKLENLSKLKKLEYLNLALNNIERIENLEGCESLQKLDLTVNFVGELTSLESLKDLYHFKDLYLTGNPCSQYEGYREYVIATLPRLQRFDGVEVEKSERIVALQNYGVTRARIIQQQLEYKKKREKQKLESQKEEPEKPETEENGDSKPGFDGRWYTDINEGDSKDKDLSILEREDKRKKEWDKEKEYWDTPVDFTPESRLEVHKHMQEQKKKENKDADKKVKKERPLFTDTGRPLNVNEGKIDFTLTDDEENNRILLDLACYKHMDTSLIDADVQTNYVRVTMKGKVFQLALDEEVNADSSTAKRSQITGSLLITMPKMKQIITKKMPLSNKPPSNNGKNKEKSRPKFTEESLEVDASVHKTVDIGNIVRDINKVVPPLGRNIKPRVSERPNSENFVDDPDVPPLE